MIHEHHASLAEGIDPDSPISDDPLLMVKECWDDCERHYGEFDDAQAEEAAFGLQLNHYLWKGTNRRDTSELAPVTADLFDLIRHKVAVVADQPIFISCLPVDQLEDPLRAEDARFVLEWEVNNPLKRYRQLRRRLVMGAFAARSWALWLDWHPYIGAYGEIVPRLVNPSRLRVAPGWQDMHDMTCPYVIEARDLRIQDVRRMQSQQQGDGGWQNTDQVIADVLVSSTPRWGSASPDGSPVLASDVTPTARGSLRKTARLLFWWGRYGQEKDDYQKVYELPAQDEYMACMSCGRVELDHWRMPGVEPSDQNSEGIPGPLPDTGNDCPECEARGVSSPLERIAHVSEEWSALRYPKGRLVIVAPGSNVVLYDGSWPCPTRSFPGMIFKCYDHMEEPLGLSDTALHWDSQLVLDALTRSGYWQMIRNQDLILTEHGGLFKADGVTPFEFTDEHGAIAYWKSPLTAKATSHFQGSGISPGLAVLYKMVRDTMAANRGSNDLGLTPDASRNIPASTISQLSQMGEIPTKDHQLALENEESVVFGCWLDMAIHYWTDERAVRTMGPDGAIRIRRLKGDDLPNVDVVVSSGHQIDSNKIQQYEAFSRWLADSDAHPAARMVGAQILNIPPSLVREYEQERVRQMQFEPSGGSNLPGRPRSSVRRQPQFAGTPR